MQKKKISSISNAVDIQWKRLINEEYISSGYKNVPNFGIWHLNIPKTAKLVVLDMWFSGQISEIKEPEDWEYNQDDPNLLASLAGHIQNFEELLISAVNTGKLKAASILRDFDENLITEATFIEHSVLCKWLNERCYDYGDIIIEWEHNESDTFDRVYSEVVFWRAAIKYGKVSSVAEFYEKIAQTGKLDETEVVEMLTSYKALVEENQLLKDQLAHAKAEQPAKVDRPISTRQRRTLLTIIAALCDFSGIVFDKRGTPQRIKEMTQTLVRRAANL